MRTVLLLLAFLLLATLSVAGFRGMVSRRPPLEPIPDMVRQPRIRPQAPSGFFEDGVGARAPVPGTVARGVPVPQEPIATGRAADGTNFVEVNPLPVTAEFIARGRERFEIYCQPCHGAQGDGKSVSARLGLTAVANLHDARIVRMPDGEIYNTISRGKNLMASYAAVLEGSDRWATIAFLRALQLSRLGLVEDLPADEQPRFTETNP